MPITRQPRRGTGRGEKGNLLPRILAVAAVMGLLGIVVGLAWQRATLVPHDKVSGCPKDGPLAVHAILIDHSDPLTPLQSQRLTQMVEGIARSAAVDERLDLYVLTSGGGAVAVPEVSLCRPRSDGNQLTENPERLRRTFENRYLEPVREALKRVVSPQEAANSPILESIKAVCVGAFGALPRTARARLTVASDMIENSAVLNQFKPYDTVAFLRGPRITAILADCHAAGVDVLYLNRPRDARVQTPGHIVFWEKVLERMNASLNSVERI
jgi:hypothetical protein